MIKLYKDMDDADLSWIVVSNTQRGSWETSISAAVEDYRYKLSNSYSKGEDPYAQDNVRVVAEAETLEELQLMAVLDGYT